MSLAVAEALQVILTNSCAGEERFSQTRVFLLKIFSALCLSGAFSVTVGVPLRPLVGFARLIAVAMGELVWGPASGLWFLFSFLAASLTNYVDVVITR